MDKSKAKPALRTEVNMAAKSGEQQPSFIHNGNQSPHGGHVKSDMPKTSGKLSVLKLGWENGVSSPTQKGVGSPTTIANSRVTASQHGVAPVISVAVRISSQGYELQITPSDKPILWCDNTSVLAVSANPVMHSKFKHVELDLFFVREKVATGNFVVNEVPSVEQVADVLTKPLSQLSFCQLRDKLGVVRMHSINVS